jgi:hypothetical protein
LVALRKDRDVELGPSVEIVAMVPDLDHRAVVADPASPLASAAELTAEADLACVALVVGAGTVAAADVDVEGA